MSTTKALKAEGAVLVAFSGGCDSLALLYLLSHVPEITRLEAVYVNHNLREKLELEKEIELNTFNCKRIGVPLRIVEIERNKINCMAKERGRGIEEAAREVRYKALEKVRIENNFDWIATAHNRDDQYETILMRIQKGSPFSSLSGIQKVNGKIIRPVLGFWRKDLEKILSDAGFRWSEDSTNAETEFTRNKIRHLIVPRLKQHIPNYPSVLDVIHDKALTLQTRVGLIKEPGLIKNYKDLNYPQKIQLLFRLWNQSMDTELSQKNCMRILEPVEKGNNENISVSKAEVMITKERIFIEKLEDLQKAVHNYNIDTNREGGTVELWNKLILTYGSSAVKRDKADIYLDSGAFVPPVRIRGARNGDRIKLKEGTKRVSRLLQEMKIPSPLRPYVPVLEDENQIVGVFARCMGGKDRISIKFRTSLAHTGLTVYIIEKGNKKSG